MPQLPVNIKNDVAMENNTTGAVDYLQFQGNTLIHSQLVDYGLGAGWNIVAHGAFLNSNEGLVAQNATTGVVDFLGLDANAHLVSSAMTSVGLPPIVGGGLFGPFFFPGEAGEPLVAQLGNGELDFLAFDNAGHLLASNTLASTIGLAHAVGVGDGTPPFMTPFPLFAGNGGSVGSGNVVLQLGDGELDAVGFTGNFGDGTLAYASSFLLPGTVGSAPVEAINQDVNAFGGNRSIVDAAGHQGVQMVSQLASGQLDTLWFDSGYNDAANEGALYASGQTLNSFAGWHVVDAGAIAVNDLFPIT
jgi:hypothetical protein